MVLGKDFLVIWYHLRLSLNCKRGALRQKQKNLLLKVQARLDILCIRKVKVGVWPNQIVQLTKKLVETNQGEIWRSKSPPKYRKWAKLSNSDVNFGNLTKSKILETKLLPNIKDYLDRVQRSQLNFTRAWNSFWKSRRAWTFLPKIWDFIHLTKRSVYTVHISLANSMLMKKEFIWSTNSQKREFSLFF